MSEQDSEQDNEKKPAKPSGSTGECVLQSPGEAVVKHEDLPAKPPKDKKIHRRRPLPLVPDAPVKESGEDQEG